MNKAEKTLLVLLDFQIGVQATKHGLRNLVGWDARRFVKAVGLLLEVPGRSIRRKSRDAGTFNGLPFRRTRYPACMRKFIQDAHPMANIGVKLSFNNPEKALQKYDM